ncbi:MAG: hypothetical protein QG670_1974 [Thermoproteota archaeon]|nr:hypothetical protein [Thermoproteota archaeon]
MDAESVRQWIKNEILKTGFKGTAGIGSFSDIYNSLIPIQTRRNKRDV